MEFYIGRTKFIFDYSFLLIVAFSVLLNNGDIPYLVLFSSLHELGHIIALYLCKGRAKEIRIAFYGIGLVYEHSFKLFQEIIFLSSGAAVNILFYLLCVKKEINGALAIINLLPVYPLDGGRIIKLVLNRFLLLNVSDYIFRFLSLLTVSVTIIYSCYTRNFSLLLIIIYIIVFSINNSSD